MGNGAVQVVDNKQLYLDRITAVETKATRRLEFKAARIVAKTAGEPGLPVSRLHTDQCFEVAGRNRKTKEQVLRHYGIAEVCENKVSQGAYTTMQRAVARFDWQATRAKIRVIDRELRQRDMVSDGYRAFLIDRKNAYKDELLKFHFDAQQRRMIRGAQHFLGGQFLGCAR